MLRDSNRLKIAMVLALVTAMAVAGLVGTAAPARADHNLAPWGSNVTVTGVGTMNNYSAAALDDGHGDLYLFRLFTPPSGNNLFVYKYSEVGTLSAPVLAAGFPVQVNGIANVVDWSFTTPQSIASATIDHAGNLYVAWTHTNTGPSRRDVYVSRSTDGGATWTLTTQVSATTADEWDQWPSIVAAPNGRIYVAWTQNMGVWWNVTVSTSADQANTWSVQKNVTEQSAPNAVANPPKLAVDSLGRVFLAYSRVAPSRTYVNLTWTEDGVSWVAPINLNSGTTSSGRMPAITVDSANRVHVAWQDSRTAFDGTTELFYVRSSDRGVTWTPQLPISQGVAPFAGSFDTQIATKGENILITWDIYGLTTPDGFDQSYVISPNHGDSWYPEVIKSWGSQSFGSYLTVDQNGTFYLATTYYAANDRMAFSWWHSPPSTPALAPITPGTGSLTVSWTPAPEADIAAYRVFRSTDGSTYNVVATVSGSATSFVDPGLANGTYWYKLESIDSLGYVSHDSQPMSGVVGPTTAQLIANLNAQIAALKAQLAAANASSAAAIAAAQAQITALQSALTNLQNSQAASNAATASQLAQLQANLTKLQGQLNNLQTQQATQTISYANLAFEVIVVVLLVVLLLNQMRRPKSPQMMMAQPAQAPPRKPDDEL